MALPTTPTPSSQRDKTWGAGLVHDSPPSRLLTPSPLASHPVSFRRQSNIPTDPTSTTANNSRRRSLTMNRLTQPSYGPKMASNSRHRRSISFGVAAEKENGVDAADGSYFVQANTLAKKTPKPPSGREDFSELVDFLSTTKPPSSNYMSTPYDSSSPPAPQPRGPTSPGDGEATAAAAAAAADKAASRSAGGGRWSMLRRVGRKNTTKKVPKPLVLPESAVSGITSGGHRHIAISIPVEGVPFAKSPESEYMHFEANPGISALPQMEPRREPIKIRKSLIDMTAEDGVVTTVLRSQGGMQKPKRVPRSVILTQNPRSHHARQWSQGRIPNNNNNNTTTTTSLNMSMSMNMGRSYHDRPGMPARGSSVSASRPPLGQAFPQYSLDMKPLPWAPPAGMARAVGREGPHASSFHPGARLQPAPIGEETAAAMRHQDRAPFAKMDPMPITTAPLPILAQLQLKPINQEHLAARPVSRDSMDGRRDRVRDKKRRDIEALRNSLSRRASEEEVSPKSGGPTAPAPAQAPAQASTSTSPTLFFSSSTSSTAPSLPPRRAAKPQLAFCPIQVVVDVEPMPKTPAKPPTFHLETLQRLIGAPRPQQQQQQQQQPRQQSVSTASSVDDECFSPMSEAQTPLTSVSSSPEQKKPAPRKPARSRQSSHREARRAEEAQRQTQTDIQIQKLYDAFHESRMQDAERRIRRLERNRDVWLRALIPLLDDMNSAIKGSKGDKHKSKSKSASKSKSKSKCTSKSKSKSKSKSMGWAKTHAAESESESEDALRKRSKRTLLKERLMAKLSELEQLEEETDDRYEDDEEDEEEEEDESEDEDDYDEDEREKGWRAAIEGLEKTGMTALEPMMRELASEMRAREKGGVKGRAGFRSRY